MEKRERKKEEKILKKLHLFFLFYPIRCVSSFHSSGRRTPSKCYLSFRFDDVTSYFSTIFGTPTGRLDGFIICTVVYYISYFNSFQNLSTEKKMKKKKQDEKNQKILTLPMFKQLSTKYTVNQWHLQISLSFINLYSTVYIIRIVSYFKYDHVICLAYFGIYLLSHDFCVLTVRIGWYLISQFIQHCVKNRIKII